MSDPEVLRQSVAAVSARLAAGEPPPEVPCPKCQQERYITIERIGASAYLQAGCDCCGFTWMLP